MVTAKDIAPALLKRFREWRKTHEDSSLSFARWDGGLKPKPESSLRWRPYCCVGGKAQWSDGPLCFTAKIEPDEDSRPTDMSDASFDESSEGSLAHGRQVPWLRRRTQRGRGQKASYDRFKNNRPPRGQRGDWRFITPGQTYDELLEMYWFQGYSKKDADILARKAWREEVQRYLDWMDDQWHYNCVDVTVHCAGVEIGSRSLCGIESDGLESHFSEVALDLAYELKAEAGEAMKRTRNELDAALSQMGKSC